jgi:hypothetical protein
VNMISANLLRRLERLEEEIIVRDPIVIQIRPADATGKLTGEEIVFKVPPSPAQNVPRARVGSRYR